MNPNTYTGEGTGLMPQVLYGDLYDDIEDLELPIKHKSKPYLMIPYKRGDEEC